AFKVGTKAESRVRRFPTVLQPADVSSLSFEITGQLKAVALAVGQKVQLGDVLAEIDSRSLQSQSDQASAGVQQAQAQADNAEADFQRKENLLGKGVTTQAIFDQSKATLLTARAQLDQAKRQLELAEHNLDRSKLVAPFSGTIARVEVKSFAQVSAGQPIVTLYSDDRFEMSFLIPSPTFQTLRVGQPVTVKVADMPDLSLKGEIKELGSKAEQVSAFPVVVRLEDKVVGLNAGMSVEVAIQEPLIGVASGFLLPLSVIAPAAGKERWARATSLPWPASPICLTDKKSSFYPSWSRNRESPHAIWSRAVAIHHCSHDRVACCRRCPLSEFSQARGPGHRHSHGGGIGPFPGNGARAHRKPDRGSDRTENPRACRSQGYQDACERRIADGLRRSQR